MLLLHTDLLNNLETLSHFFHPDQIPKNITGNLIKQIKTVKSAQMPPNNPYFAIIIFKMKGNFPLAECNELSGKCFSHTPLGAWV